MQASMERPSVQQRAVTGATKLGGKMKKAFANFELKKAVRDFFDVTNGGLSLYDLAGEVDVPADILNGRAEEERRRAEKGKGCMAADDDECDRMSTDSAFSMEQQPETAEQRLRRLAAAVLSASTPSVADAVERATTGGSRRTLPPHRTTSIHSQGSSIGSSIDMELAVFALPSSSGSAAAGPSHGGSARSSSSAWEAAGSSSGGSGSAWGTPGPSSSNGIQRYANMV